jgi:hypothetical protein
VKKAQVKSFLPTGKVKEVFAAALGTNQAQNVTSNTVRAMDSSWRETPNVILDDCASEETRAELHNYLLPS